MHDFFKISFHTNVIPCPWGGSSFRAQNLYEFGQLLGIEDFALLKVFCSWREQAWNRGNSTSCNRTSYNCSLVSRG